MIDTQKTFSKVQKELQIAKDLLQIQNPERKKGLEFLKMQRKKIQATGPPCRLIASECALSTNFSQDKSLADLYVQSKLNDFG